MDTRDVDELAEQGRPENDAEHHRGGARRIGEDLVDVRQSQAAARHGEEQRRHRADSGRLDRGEETAIDAAHHHAEDHQHRPQRAQQRGGVHLLGLVGQWRHGRVAPHAVLHCCHVAHDRDKAWDDARGEQHPDVRLRRHAIHHHDDGRRDENAERAARGDRCRRQRVAIAQAPHGRNGHLAHRRRGGHAGAADGPETAASRYGCHGQPAAAAADDGLGCAEQVARDPGARHQIAHQHEQRQHDEGVDERGIPRDVGHHAERGRPAAQYDHPAEAH